MDPEDLVKKPEKVAWCGFFMRFRTCSPRFRARYRSSDLSKTRAAFVWKRPSKLTVS